MTTAPTFGLDPARLATLRQMAFASYWAQANLLFSNEDHTAEDAETGQFNVRTACAALIGRKVSDEEWNWCQQAAACWNHALENETPLIPVTNEDWNKAAELVASGAPGL